MYPRHDQAHRRGPTVTLCECNQIGRRDTCGGQERVARPAVQEQGAIHHEAPHTPKRGKTFLPYTILSEGWFYIRIERAWRDYMCQFFFMNVQLSNAIVSGSGSACFTK